MRLIFLLVLVIGIGTAGYAAFLIQGQFGTKDAEIGRLNNELRKIREQVVETTPVVVLANRVAFAHKLVAEDLSIVAWPSTALPENTFTSIEEVIGGITDGSRYVKRVLEVGEPLMAVKVTEFGEDVGIITLLEPGTRAVTIRVDVTSGVSGFLRPGAEVDIYWTGQSGNKNITRLVLERVKIIAIDQQSSQDGINPTIARTVTMQVSPDIVANLVQLQNSGKLSLSLRGVEDTTTSGPFEVDTNTIIGIENNVVVAPDKCFRRERRGVEVINIEVPCEASTGG